MVSPLISMFFATNDIENLFIKFVIICIYSFINCSLPICIGIYVF